MRNTKRKTEIRVIDRQRGAVILLVTFSLLAFLGLMALALDLGQMYVVKTQLQNAADAGALRGAKELNGTLGGIGVAEAKAKEAAADGNGFLLVAKTRMQQSQVTVEFADHPTATWYPASHFTGPNSAYYVRVWTDADTAVNQISAFFAGVLGIWDKAAKAVAIAGRYPQPGRVMPMFMPALRRNIDQTNGTACNGKLFDTKDNGHAFDPSNCPSATDLASPAITDIRGPDEGDATGSKNWGYLRAGESRSFGNSSVDRVNETGSYYIFRLDPNASIEWVAAGTVWTGNFGWLEEKSTQLDIQQAVCKGYTEKIVDVPGCVDVHTGGLSTPAFVDALNSRFDTTAEKDLPKDMTYATCPADRNVYVWPDPVPPTASAYNQYKVNSPTTPPPSHPTGAPNRRKMRLFVVDNYMPQFNGYSDGVTTCQPYIQGSNKPAHVVGCAEFFMYKPSDKASQGLMYAEFVQRVPDNECTLGSSPETFSDIRLYR